MWLEPYGSRLIAKQTEDDKIGLIYLAEHTKKGSLRATVKAIGPECTWVNEGDVIFFGRYAKFDLPLTGEEWRDWFIMNEDDILLRQNEGERDG
jgi:co-chaperonin GroES (HSP10)